MSRSRREFLMASGAAAALAALAGCAAGGTPRAAGKVVVVGGGYGGATAAKYLRMWGGGGVDVTLIERNAQFVSCPISNLVLGGVKRLDEMTLGYDGLARRGVKVVRDEAKAIDPVRRAVSLAAGGELSYDRLVISPGVDFIPEALPGLNDPGAPDKVLHAWKAGAQTLALRRRLEALHDGGVYAITIPKAPYRCPPGPYERACMVAHYFKNAKPKSKVLILDANEDVVSKKTLFTKFWSDAYKGIVEYRPNSELRDVDAKNMTAVLEFDKVNADVLNVVPPQRAADIARAAGLITANERWCGVDWLSMESLAQKHIHVLGDATLAAPAMPKSGHMANQHAKVAAAAILNALAGQPPNPEPMMVNTCYSFVDAVHAIHISSVHRYDPVQKTLVSIQGAGGLSAAPNEAEGKFALAWARNIWADMLG